MDSSLLPGELRELESRLRHRRSVEPPRDLRARILQEIESGLSGPQSAGRQTETSYWAAAAAAILIVMNLSMICGAESAYTMGSGISSEQFQSLQPPQWSFEGISR